MNAKDRLRRIIELEYDHSNGRINDKEFIIRIKKALVEKW